MPAERRLTEAQRRALRFAAEGCRIESLRPGSNHADDVEYTYSTLGVGLFFDGPDIEFLLRAGYLRAGPSDPRDVDDEIVADHQVYITEAGRALLQDSE